jgi:hypothetical protein
MNKFWTIAFALFACNLSYGQIKHTVSVDWNKDPQSISANEAVYKVPTCESCKHSLTNEFAPVISGVIPLPKGYAASDVNLQVLEYEPLEGDFSNMNVQEFEFNWFEGDDRGKRVVTYEVSGVTESSSGGMDGIKKFEVIIKQNRIPARRKSASFTTSSVMANGDWYRIGVAEDGIYRINRSDLVNLGIDVSSLDPAALNIFGNSYGQLPYENSVERPDDLLTNAIYVEGEADGSFDNDDYILFFAKGPHKWTYNEETQLFDHQKHEYTDTSYYFIGINTGLEPKRITGLNSTGSSPNYTVETFDDYAFHEVDRENMIKSGREWYGEKFDVQTIYNFGGENFTFPNIDFDFETVVRADLISRSTVSLQPDFEMEVGGETVSEDFPPVGTGVTSRFASQGNLELRTNNVSPNLNIQLRYIKRTPTQVGWLNWLSVNTRREMKMAGTQMIFRDIQSVGEGRVSRFTIQNAGNVEEVWEVTDPSNIRRVNFDRVGDELNFTLPTPELREFIAFSGGFKTATLFGRSNNQDLHALGTSEVVDMIIVAPGSLYANAQQLADIHRNYEPDPLNVEVVRLQEVYNEFSSGMRDVTAIKWLMKMLYDRAGENEDMMPRYLLLFGDGSYDNQNFTPGNSNLIPTFQSLNSLSPVNSYVSDDYFGFLSDDEGESQTDVMDIGVGRLVVKNVNEANSVVNKIRRYMDTSPQQFDADCSVCGNNTSNRGQWRNIITLLADDEDSNSHMSNSQIIGNKIEGYTSDYNIEKLFIDAFPQVVTPGGQRYPDVNAALDRRVRNGAFIINYIGHGGELGLAQERILDIPTILEWENGSNLPIFMTATCEFTRFDDPLRTSAGEYVLLNGNGGGIALLTTTRLVYAFPNFELNKSFYDALFDISATETPVRLGDVSRETKNRELSSSSSNHRNFTLVGDPALPMALPKYRAVVNSITDTLGNPIDTLKALGVARVSGQIQTDNGSLKSDFNGRLNATVFDRIEEKFTLGNDGGEPWSYTTQEKIVYRGNAEVTNGTFQFDFVIPKDISFAVDSTARISLYAVSELDDATGFADSLKIGDRDPDAVNDGSGPDIELYLNDENFVFGGYTNSTPILVADIFDENGINTVGSGIGHDITAVIDGNTSNTIVLNDYYESDLNTFKSGRVQYQFDELSPGNHTLELKVWDVHNNSNSTQLEFVVAENEEFTIERVLNYPNPFTTSTEFFFEHNQSCEFLNVLVQVYTVSGKLVKSINVVSNTDGFRNEPIPWDGRDDYGDRLATGVYVYKMSVRNPAGEQVEKFEKLVILN